MDNREELDSYSQEEIEEAARQRVEHLRPNEGEWGAYPGWSEREFDELVESYVESQRAKYQKTRAYRELEDKSVIWDRVSAEACDALEEILGTSSREEDVHRFLAERPEFLVQTLGGGHGRFQLSKVALGNQFVADFLIAEASSIGMEWYLVEIEKPNLPLEREDGSFRYELNHAIDQIKDWRTWIGNNRDYARRPQDQGGLGLVGIDSGSPGLVIGGRRHDYSARFNEFRRQTARDQRILVHSYDWLLDTGRINKSGRLGGDLSHIELYAPEVQ